MRKKGIGKSKNNPRQLEFSGLLRVDSPSSTREESFSEGFFSNERGDVVVAGRPEEIPWGTHNLDTEIQRAIEKQDPEGYIQCLLYGAEDHYPFTDEERQSLLETAKEIRRREREIRRRERDLDRQVTLATKRLMIGENYQRFLSSVGKIGFSWKNIPRLRSTIMRYFPRTKVNLRTMLPLGVRKYLNRRIAEASHELGIPSQTWVTRTNHPEKYQGLSDLPDWDTDSMRRALEDNFPQFTNGTQPLEDYSPEQIRIVYSKFLSQRDRR